MAVNFEIRGALPVRASFKHFHAWRFAESIANPAEVYFATDDVTHAVVLRISGTLAPDEQQSVEDALARFARRWASAGAIFSRVCYGQPSLLPVGPAAHVALLADLATPQARPKLRTQRTCAPVSRLVSDSA
jgi:hypothetical protein